MNQEPGPPRNQDRSARDAGEPARPGGEQGDAGAERAGSGGGQPASEAEGVRRVPVALNDTGRQFLRTVRPGPGALGEEESLDLTLRRPEGQRRIDVAHAGDVVGEVRGDVAHELHQVFEECGRRRSKGACEELQVRAAAEEAAEGRPEHVEGEGPEAGRLEKHTSSPGHYRLVLLLPPRDRLFQALVVEQDR